MTNITIKDRYQVRKADPYYDVWDCYENGPLVVAYERYSEAAIKCNELNEKHHKLLRWSLDNCTGDVQINLDLF